MLKPIRKPLFKYIKKIFLSKSEVTSLLYRLVAFFLERGDEKF